ncbi:site-specific DNA-methyltransferase [Acinetobacter beijerinckii]|uniref:site-specific DNA-methyltransferase n=1 Tax=Acinetobacter beijerinckii TaxID=262668 RepID=UPI0023DDD444|nr:site-specific DNA-methyltransferase [Acinetobacter beijerinckii]MDF2416174.1 site-specific DNA-methyltransferase [Acinetobacter beijerinckii]
MTTENNTLDLTEENHQEGVFKFEPIKGYPMLNWKGKRPFTSTRYYPAQLKEQHGEAINGWLNKIFWGDNLQVMSHLLREFRGKVDLIYIDPPFDSKADYKKKISLKSGIAANDQSVFEEKQYLDIWANDEYLQFIYDRVILLKELLSASGSFYIHCDWHKSHHIRCILDEIFGAENFRNEIVWKRSDAKGDAGQGSKHFSRLQDTIYFYTKTNNYTWNPLYTPLDESYINNFYRHIDAEGERYKLENMLGPGGAAKGNPVYEVFGVTRAWRYSQEKMAQKIKDGLVIQTNPGTVPMEKKLLKDSKGRQVGTWWDDISMIRGFSKQKTDYPTQKPETLLERILYASSNRGDLVFDGFMGSGTTQAAAMKLGRKFVGADINLGAIQTTTKRLIKVAEELRNTEPELGEEQALYTGFEVFNVNHYDVFRNPVQAKELLIQALDVQSIPNSVYDGEKDGRMVKLMSVNHIATRADVADLIHGVDYKVFEKRKEEKPNQPVEKITIFCMGHEPDLAAFVEQSIGYKLDIEVIDILRDRSDLQFKRDSEALFKVEEGNLVVDKFYPMNLLQKLSQTKESISDWREMVESIMIDWNYDGAVFQPTLTDIPAKNELVQGQYTIPNDAGTIRIKITDLLSESLERDLTEEELANG